MTSLAQATGTNSIPVHFPNEGSQISLIAEGDSLEFYERELSQCRPEAWDDLFNNDSLFLTAVGWGRRH